MAPKHDLHSGEISLQKLRGAPSALTTSIPNYISRNMPLQHADFFDDLSYLPLATLDKHGRPWASILITMSGNDPSVGINVSDGNQIDVIAETNPYDPFLHALGQSDPSANNEKQLFAGVGVDFTNRRRNKIAGSIIQATADSAGTVNLRLISDQHLGNCPKYITIRSLEHHVRDAKLVLKNLEAFTVPLPKDAKTLIGNASTVFLATKHTVKHSEGSSDEQDMGFNHRGGAPGFVRVYEEEIGDVVTTYLILPDHSGNRFYQSLGNIETDEQVGLVLPDFITGDILYVTGNAKNLHGADAESIMPRVDLLTRIQVTGAVFIKGGLNMRLVSEEHYSPYNPPVRYLRRELEEMGHLPDTFRGSEPIGATLVSTQGISENISTFTFELSSLLDPPLPGGFGIFDFSKILDDSYRHMSDDNPQLVNDDYVRTWTLSSAPSFDAEEGKFLPSKRVSVTVKRKAGGLVSNILHDHAEQLVQREIQIGFKGTGSGFTCFSSGNPGILPSIPAKMLWIAGGVGITPFMSMWDGITNVSSTLSEVADSDIILLFSGRGDDINVLRHFLSRTDSIPKQLNLRIFAFQSAGNNPTKSQLAFKSLSSETSGASLQVEQRRVKFSDISAIEDLADREIFMCGPDVLMRWADNSLDELNIEKSQIHQESFFF